MTKSQSWFDVKINQQGYFVKFAMPSTEWCDIIPLIRNDNFWFTLDLSRAEKKTNVVTSWSYAQNDIHFTQNDQSWHFEGK